MCSNNNISSYNNQVEIAVNIPIDQLARIVRSGMFKLNFSKSSKHKRQLSIIKQSIAYWLKGRVLYKSEFTLGDEYGVSPDTISRDIPDLIMSYILEVKHRMNNSNVYLLSPYCFIPKILKELIRWFPELDALNMANVELTKSSLMKSYNKDRIDTLDDVRLHTILWIREFLKEYGTMDKEKDAIWNFFCDGLDYIPPEGTINDICV